MIKQEVGFFFFPILFFFFFLNNFVFTPSCLTKLAHVQIIQTWSDKRITSSFARTHTVAKVAKFVSSRFSEGKKVMGGGGV